jgi:hypothetical protein
MTVIGCKIGKAKIRYTRKFSKANIGLTTFSGNVRKTGSQMSNRWAIYTLVAICDETGKTFTSDITKMYKIWINNKDGATTSDIDSQIRHCLGEFARLVPISAEQRKIRLADKNFQNII